MTTDDDMMVTDDELDRLSAAAAEILRWKQEKGWSWPKMLRKFPRIGSDKTCAKLAARSFADLKVSRWVRDYTRALADIKSFESSLKLPDTILQLSYIADVQDVIYRTLPHEGLDRFVLIEGPSGAGKSGSLAWIQQEYPSQCRRVEADDSWKSGRIAAGDILKALNVSDVPYAMVRRRDALITALAERKILLIDEGHHIGAETLSLLKTIINRTRTVVVLAGVDTLWSKLTETAGEEARQLLHNRMSGRVRLLPPTPEDVHLYFAPLGEMSERAAEAICEDAEIYGRYSMLRKIRDHALAALRDAGADGRLEDVLAAAMAAARYDLGFRG